MRENKIQQKLENLNKALSRFATALNAPIDPDQLMIEASIQCFEFSYELTWKFLKDVLEKEGIPANSPREVFREAYSANIISDENLWLTMLNDRNLTTHVYNKKIALEIYGRAKDYFLAMKKLYESYSSNG